MSHDADVGLTDVWHNTPLHYMTRELFTVDKVAETVEKVLNEKNQLLFIRNSMDSLCPF